MGYASILCFHETVSLQQTLAHFMAIEQKWEGAGFGFLKESSTLLRGEEMYA